MSCRVAIALSLLICVVITCYHNLLYKFSYSLANKFHLTNNAEATSLTDSTLALVSVGTKLKGLMLVVLLTSSQLAVGIVRRFPFPLYRSFY